MVIMALYSVTDKLVQAKLLQCKRNTRAVVVFVIATFTYQYIALLSLCELYNSIHCHTIRNGGNSQPGIIPLAIYQCFEQVNDFPDREFLLRVSYFEVYNEQIKDLLSTSPVPIKIQHDPKLGTVISGHKEQVVLSPEQVNLILHAYC